MMKIVASLLILGLCANVAIATTVAIAGTSQGSAFSGLNSTAQKVFTASNSTDATNWDSTVASATAGTTPTGIPYGNVVFGPGATNDTSYVYGYAYTTTGGVQSLTTIVVRTLNNTIVAYGNDTGVETFTKSESKISSSIIATTATFGVGPGVLAVLSTGTDSTSNKQVYYTLVSGTTATPVKVTSTADVVTNAPTNTIPAVGAACTTTSFSLGNIWYDQGSQIFFYTYSKSVATTATATTAGTCPGSSTTVNNIYLGAVYLNGTAAISTPLALSVVTPANSISALTSGPDNYLNATNVYVVYKDATVSTGGANSAIGITYQQKIAKSTAPTAGSFSALVSDTITGTIATGTASTSVVSVVNTPLSVWASNFTYGIAVANVTQTQTSTQYNAGTAGTMAYTISNYLNSSLTWADSGISYSSAMSVAGLYGWQLNTGYTLVARWLSSSTSTPEDTYAYTWGTFYANGTVNATSTTLGSAQGPVSFYEDVNGTQWIGWTDLETANTPTLTYAGYLAKLQGQLNVPSGASILSAISAFFALFLAAIFVF